ncbi:probable disease resistance protein At4g19060 [Pyrus communis]|uniref:probable disease resistance protein At4g19060 n=1 Tax=Pyrus communis TaxID=23211 RepID=UPI0035C03471
MAQEIEKYLMEKFRNGLDGRDKSISKIPKYSQFQEIKILLDDIFSSSLHDSSIRNKLYDLNNVLAECQMLSRKHGFNSPKELLTINRIRRDLNRIKRELKFIKDNKRSLHGNTDPQPNNGQASSTGGELSRWTTRSLDASKVYGFDDDVILMKKLLLQQGTDDRFRAVGIVGREGIGKTTLCQVLFNEQEVKNTFLPRIWVCMARHPDDDDNEVPKIVIVKRMLMHLGVGKEMVKSVCEKHGLGGLLYALRLQLMGKRYLIVLDHARETDSWCGQLDSCLTRDKEWDDGLAFGLPKGHGGRLIVTSRNEDIAKMMVGKENIHHLLPLSDHESCWAIFIDAVGRIPSSPSNLEDVTDDEGLWAILKDAVENNRTPSRPSNLEDLINNESFWAIYLDGVKNNWISIPSGPSDLEDLKLEVKEKCGGIPLALKMMGQATQESLKVIRGTNP